MHDCRSLLGVLAMLCVTVECTPAAMPAPAPSTAHRDPTCVGDCLTGKDPFDTGCAADAHTVKLAHVVTDAGEVIGVVELRVSPACGTGWARILRTDEMSTGDVFGGITVDGGATWLTHRSKHAISLWTDMHYIPHRGCTAATAVLYDAVGRAVADETQASDCVEHRANLASRQP